MADYSQWKVTDLKAELKRRGIPQTGLRLKQNFVDRLIEDDANSGPGGVEEAQAKSDDQAEPKTSDAPDGEGAQTDSQEAAPEGVVAKEPRQTEEDVTGKPEDNDQKEEEEEASEHPPDKTAASPVQEKEVEPAGPEMPPAAAEPVTEAPKATEDSAIADVQPETADGGESRAEEAGRTGTQVSETNTGLSTPLPMEEVLEDARKRKRRSPSPVPTPRTLAIKRARIEEKDEDPQVNLKEDASVEETFPVEDAQPTSEPREKEASEERDVPRRPSVTEDARLKKQDARFKGLFAATEREPTRPTSPPADAGTGDAEVEAALHVATAALYIDGLMRPLQPNGLRNHLVNLASAPGTSPNPDVILHFYLDQIKTHCFATFASVSAASRVRSALHGTVWPNERNRKVLFADFVPETQAQKWVDTEEQAQRRGGSLLRWIVKYEPTDHGVEAVHQEVDARAAAGINQPRNRDQLAAPLAPPTGPRGSISQRDRRPSTLPAPSEPSSRPGQGFKALDDLFSYTKTKPKLYYLPVAREVADRRLDRFDELVRKGSFPRHGGDEMRRISFEDTDQFVDNGPEYPDFGQRNRPRRRGRGGGGLGSSWRGRD
ncbi:hypothetical protein ASPZODRAFT_129235 [Penicilliopsis zonata CBS 506.65]|uniref:SAP domain-containing protein n=1 Tax=Penicilliopsis zonata CBS 506.65 TaxID=1073090 RepID=A0A1L9SPE6_9EURO|nr:hypothetical protein ASPZODRAFT_129235 [Penicilliopsis zonata CBS 506.65]OJJ48907.1 hypothetical protein ASPZODRAFT_129235 [Penicilliopsis zonata CBS 506.65]